MKIERFDLDAQGKPCSEGYYVVTDRNELVLFPPTAGIEPSCVARGYRFATRDEVNTLPTVEAARGARKPHVGRHAMLEEIAPTTAEIVVTP